VPITNDEIKLQDIEHGVVSVLIENPFTEPYFRRWYELSDYSRISPSEHQPPKSDAEKGERIMARLQESWARHEHKYEHFNRIKTMVLAVAFAIERYLFLENMDIRRRRDLIGKINGIEKFLLQDDSKTAKIISEVRSKIRSETRKKNRRT